MRAFRDFQHRLRTGLARSLCNVDSKRNPAAVRGFKSSGVSCRYRVSMDPKPLVAVTNLREFFHDSVQAALRKQRVDVDDHTEHYVVNVLTMFARSEELYDITPEGVRLKPLAHMLADAAEAPSLAAARRSAAPARRRLAVHRRVLRAELRAQAHRHRLPHRDGRPRLRHARRQPARHAARPGVRDGLPRARAEVPAPGRRAQRSRGDGAHAHRPATSCGCTRSG